MPIYRRLCLTKQDMGTSKTRFLLICGLLVICYLVGQRLFNTHKRPVIPTMATRRNTPTQTQKSTMAINPTMAPITQSFRQATEMPPITFAPLATARRKTPTKSTNQLPPIPECTPSDQSQAIESYAAEMRQIHAFLTYFLGYKSEAMCASNAGQKKAYNFDVPPLVKYTSSNIPIIKEHFAIFSKAAEGIVNKTVLICRYRVSLHSAPNASHPTTAIYLVSESDDKSGRGSKTRAGLVPSWRTSDTRMPRGGSSLRVVTSGLHTRGVCHVHDRLDGTYLATCPVYESNTTIHFRVIRQLWAQFIASLPISSQEGTIGRKSINPFKDFNIVKRLSDQNTAENDKLNLWWKEPTGQWVWYRNGQRLEILRIAQLKKCLRSVSNLIGIGDSHVRYIMSYLYIQLGLLDSKLPSTDQYAPINNTAFFNSTSAVILAKRLKGLEKSMDQNGLKPATSPSKQDVLIINACHHDLHTRLHIVTYVKSMEYLFKNIADLKRRKGDSLRMIWIGCSPSPDGKFRSSEVIAGLHGWIYPRMAALGVEVIDVFPILYPVHNKSFCDKHFYLCVTPDREVSGGVRKTLFSAIFHKICHY